MKILSLEQFVQQVKEDFQEMNLDKETPFGIPEGYATAKMLYETLKGSHPYFRNKSLKTFKRILSGDYESGPFKYKKLEPSHRCGTENVFNLDNVREYLSLQNVKVTALVNKFV